MDSTTLKEVFRQLSDDTNPKAQDAAWWRLQFEWRHERQEEERNSRKGKH
jgi:hypothetical protein